MLIRLARSREYISKVTAAAHKVSTTLAHTAHHSNTCTHTARMHARTHHHSANPCPHYLLSLFLTSSTSLSLSLLLCLSYDPPRTLPFLSSHCYSTPSLLRSVGLFSAVGIQRVQVCLEEDGVGAVSLPALG